MNLQDLIAGGIGRQATSGIASKLGIDQEKTQWVVSAAIPLMVSALNYNAGKTEEKASQINHALGQHTGNIFDQMDSHFEQGPTEEENRIVNHMFGKNTSQVTESLALKTGLSSEKISSVLAMLAPIVMGFLGKQKQGNASEGGIGDLLGGLLGGGGSSALPGGLGGLLGSVLGGDKKSSEAGIGGIGDIVGDFFKKGDDKEAKGGILDTLAGMFGK